MRRNEFHLKKPKTKNPKTENQKPKTRDTKSKDPREKAEKQKKKCDSRKRSPHTYLWICLSHGLGQPADGQPIWQ